MKHPLRAPGVAVVLVLLLTPAGAARAGLTYDESFQRVEAKAEDAGPLDVVTGAGFAPFAGAATSESRSPDGKRTRARATQSSTFGDGFVRVSGDVAARSELHPARYLSGLTVGFAVTEPTPYTLDASLALTATGPAGPRDSSEPLFSVGIAQGRVLSRPGPGVVGVSVTRPEFESGAEQPEISAAGTLAPGNYVLRLTVSAYVDAVPITGGVYDVADVHGSYTLDFRFGDGPNPGPGPAVPLPPAVWGGLLTLGGIAAARMRATRQSA